MTPVSGGKYIADTRYAADYRAVALRTTGTTKATATAGYKTWLGRASRYAAACSAAGSHPGPTPPKPPRLPPVNPAQYATPEPEKIPAPAATATSLQFNFSGARSVALSSGTSTRATLRANVRAHATASSSGSGLDVVSASGQTSDAVVNGTSTISHFYIAPNNEVFVAFSGPVNLADPSTAPAQGQGCVLAEIDPTVGNPACVDSTLSSMYWPAWPSNGIQSPAIQFDSTGAIYYLGAADGGTNKASQVPQRGDHQPDLRSGSGPPLAGSAQWIRGRLRYDELHGRNVDAGHQPDRFPQWHQHHNSQFSGSLPRRERLHGLLGLAIYGSVCLRSMRSKRLA